MIEQIKINQKEPIEDRINNLAKELVNFLEPKGAFKDIDGIKGLPLHIKEERKISKVRIALINPENKKSVEGLAKLLRTKKEWESKRNELEAQSGIPKRRISLVNSVLNQIIDQMNKKLQKLGLLNTDKEVEENASQDRIL